MWVTTNFEDKKTIVDDAIESLKRRRGFWICGLF
jgi:hypothetical protein